MRDEERMTCVPEKAAAYEQYVAINQDAYGNAAVCAGAHVGGLLDEGKTPAEAYDGLDGHDLTGYLAGCAASAIAHFHPRGDEFRRWWNLRHQIEGEGERANNEGGILNPAILIINIEARR